MHILTSCSCCLAAVRAHQCVPFNQTNPTMHTPVATFMSVHSREPSNTPLTAKQSPFNARTHAQSAPHPSPTHNNQEGLCGPEHACQAQHTDRHVSTPTRLSLTQKGAPPLLLLLLLLGGSRSCCALAQCTDVAAGPHYPTLCCACQVPNPTPVACQPCTAAAPAWCGSGGTCPSSSCIFRCLCFSRSAERMSSK